MHHEQLIGRYARALFYLAEKNSELEKVENDFVVISQLLAKHPEITQIIKSPTLSRAEKERFVGNLFSPGISRLLIDFVKTLIQKKRFLEIEGIREAYHKLYEKKLGIQEVQVITATALPETTRERLGAVLKSRLHATIRLIPSANPSLLGGMILRFNGNEIDASFKSRLNELRQKLMASTV